MTTGDTGRFRAGHFPGTLFATCRLTMVWVNSVRIPLSRSSLGLLILISRSHTSSMACTVPRKTNRASTRCRPWSDCNKSLRGVHGPPSGSRRPYRGHASRRWECSQGLFVDLQGDVHFDSTFDPPNPLASRGRSIGGHSLPLRSGDAGRGTTKLELRFLSLMGERDLLKYHGIHVFPERSSGTPSSVFPTPRQDPYLYD